jgi:hypothetical protein
VPGLLGDEDAAREHDEDLSRTPRDLEVYAHVEGLVGEETELLEDAEHGRQEEHRRRLHAITQDLDHAWETLRQRAERRAK